MLSLSLEKTPTHVRVGQTIRGDVVLDGVEHYGGALKARLTLQYNISLKGRNLTTVTTQVVEFVLAQGSDQARGQYALEIVPLRGASRHQGEGEANIFVELFNQNMVHVSHELLVKEAPPSAGAAPRAATPAPQASRTSARQNSTPRDLSGYRALKRLNPTATREHLRATRRWVFPVGVVLTLVILYLLVVFPFIIGLIISLALVGVYGFMVYTMHKVKKQFDMENSLLAKGNVMCEENACIVGQQAGLFIMLQTRQSANLRRVVANMDIYEKVFERKRLVHYDLMDTSEVNRRRHGFWGPKTKEQFEEFKRSRDDGEIKRMRIRRFQKDVDILREELERVHSLTIFTTSPSQTQYRLHEKCPMPPKYLLDPVKPGGRVESQLRIDLYFSEDRSLTLLYALPVKQGF